MAVAEPAGPAPTTRASKRCIMQGRGFEPLKAEPAGLQPAPFGHSGTPARLRSVAASAKRHPGVCEAGGDRPAAVYSGGLVGIKPGLRQHLRERIALTQPPSLAVEGDEARVVLHAIGAGDPTRRVADELHTRATEVLLL